MSTTLSFAEQRNKWDTAALVEEAADIIRKHENLKCLVLEANTLGVEAAKVMGDALASHPEFERAHWKDLFTGRLKTEIPDALRHLFDGLVRAGAKLKELDLSDNALGPVGVRGMVDFMSSPVCYSLEELRLNNNGLGIEGGTMLAKSLLKLAEKAKAAGTPLSLKVFIAGRNRLEKDGARVFAEFFRAVGSLEEVAMPQNGIFYEGIAALADALSTNTNLKVLNLNDNTFTPKGARAMAEKLPMMQNLEVINFGDCLLKTAGALQISKALTTRHLKLKELHLDSNEIGIEGGLAIANAMVNKVNLTKLMLDCNQFGEEGRGALVSVLEEVDRLDALASLDDDEEPDSEEEDDDDNEEDDDEDEYEDDDDEDDDDDDDDEDEEDDDEEAVQELAPIRLSPNKQLVLPVKCSAIEFYEQPTAARFLGLGNSGPSQLIAQAKIKADGSNEAYIFHCFGMIMRAAGLATASDEKVKNAVMEAADKLAQELFVFAQKNDLVSVATNSLLVHLGLIKCEDKNFTMLWDLGGSITVLQHIVTQPYFPKDTKNTLQLFFGRPLTKFESCREEKHKLMKVLFQ